MKLLNLTLKKKISVTTKKACTIAYDRIVVFILVKLFVLCFNDSQLLRLVLSIIMDIVGAFPHKFPLVKIVKVLFLCTCCNCM